MWSWKFFLMKIFCQKTPQKQVNGNYIATLQTETHTIKRQWEDMKKKNVFESKIQKMRTEMNKNKEK